MKNHRKLLQLLQANAKPRAEGVPAIRLDATQDEPHVYIYDVIDAWWGASAAGLIEALAGLGDRTVHMHINSPGGDVFEGRAMAAAVVSYAGRVITHIDGLAASAATYVAMSGNEVRITQGGMLMVHEGWTIGMGNKRELAKTVDLLDKVDHQIAADYARRTGVTVEQALAWMEAETWFTEEEALAAKFVDAIDPNTKRDAEAAAQASATRWDLSAFARAPKFAPSTEDLSASIAAQLQSNRNRLRLITQV